MKVKTQIHQMKKYDRGDCERAEVLMALDMTGIAGELERLHERAARTAKLYARNKLLEYSKAHPERLCELYVGNGDATLHVSRKFEVTDWHPDAWIFVGDQPAYIRDRKFQGPEFLRMLWKFGESVGAVNTDWFARGRMKAMNGGIFFDDLD